MTATTTATRCEIQCVPRGPVVFRARSTYWDKRPQPNVAAYCGSAYSQEFFETETSN
jgi:hypothetical protein